MLGKTKAPLLLALCATALLGLTPRPAAAEVTITPVEWLALPDFCRPSIIGSIYVQRVPFELRTQGEFPQSFDFKSVGIPGPHHFCFGLVHLTRARRGAENYDLAIGELSYSYDQMDRKGPYFAFASARLGTALYLGRKPKQASRVWAEGISVQPARREVYLAMAEALLSEKRPAEALKVLEKYEENKEGDYPDAEHFLAQTHFDLKNYAEAKAHAEKAYELGYPVFGLREKLKRIGKW